MIRNFAGVIRADIELYKGMDNVVDVELYDESEEVFFYEGPCRCVIKRHVEDVTPLLECYATIAENSVSIRATAEQMQAVGTIPSHGLTLHYDVIQQADGERIGVCYGRVRVRGGLQG